MTKDKMVEILWAMVAKEGSQTAVAKILGITPSYLSDILNDNRDISEKVAKKIGYFKMTVYEPIDGVE